MYDEDQDPDTIASDTEPTRSTHLVKDKWVIVLATKGPHIASTDFN